MLLRSKLFAPPIRQEFILRADLCRQLDRLSGGDMALVEAPAGYGKSTLVSQWGFQDNVAFSWLTLDEGDNHPHQFADYFSAALQKLSGKTDSLEMDKNISNTPLLTKVSWLLNQFAVDMAEQQSGQFCVLVLDDIHKIDNKEVVSALNLILDYIPRQLSIIMTSRNELLHLHFPRRRINQKVIEIGFQDLSFSESETKQLLNESMHLELSGELIHRLQEKTEGWISGIHLSALSLSKTANKKKLIEQFSGNNRLVEEYLVGEVLAALPDDAQTFLLLTSCLKKFSAALTDEILNRCDSEEQLKELEKRNSFLVPLDDEGEWYRYHDLFADLLRKVCMKKFPNHEMQIYMRAASWLESIGHLKEACGYWIESCQWSQAVAFLTKHGASFIQQGDLTQIQEWIDRLPKEIQSSNAHIMILKAESLSDSQKTVLGESLLNQAEQLLKHHYTNSSENLNSSVELLVDIDLQRAYLARLKGDLSASTQASKKALDISQSQGLQKCTHAFRGLGEDHYMRGDMGLAQQALQQAIEFGKQEGELYGVMVSNNYLVAVLSVQGFLRQAIEQCRAIEDWLLHQGADEDFIHLRTNLALADVYRELNELERAENIFIQSLNVVSNAPASLEKVYVNLSYSRFLNSQGRLQEALQVLDAAAFCQRSVNTHWSFGWASVEALKAKCYLRIGRLDMAMQWIEQLDEAVLKSDEYATEEERIIAAHILGLQGNHIEAFAILESVERAARKGSRIQKVLSANLVRSILLSKNGDINAAENLLLKALEVAAPLGFIRLFLDFGQDLFSLLQRVKAPTELKGYLNELFKAAEQDRCLSLCDSAPDSATEILSKREQKVLALLGEGLKDKEIAAQLHIALSTVKTHTRNIYQKLGVTNRTRAIVLAKEKDLIQ